MRTPTFLLILVSVAGVSFLSGCTSSTDPGDRDFFNRGWLNPKELDSDDNFRRPDRGNRNAEPPPVQLDEPLRI